MKGLIEKLLKSNKEEGTKHFHFPEEFTNYLARRIEDSFKGLMSEMSENLTLDRSENKRIFDLLKKSYASLIYENVWKLALQEGLLSLKEDAHFEIAPNYKLELDKIIFKQFVLANIMVTVARKEASGFIKQMEEYARKLYSIEKGKNHEDLPNRKKNKRTNVSRGKFPTETQLHNAILKIKNWETMSYRKLSKELNLSETRLAQLLNENKWSMPKGYIGTR